MSGLCGLISAASELDLSQIDGLLGRHNDRRSAEADGMSSKRVCWKCGAPIGALPLPLSRLAECPSCRTELHVCRMCRFYDTGVAKHCREPIAEEVKDKQRANFCGYLELADDAYHAPDLASEQVARARLDDLFGGAQGKSSASDQHGGALNDLFRKPGGDD